MSHDGNDASGDPRPDGPFIKVADRELAYDDLVYLNRMTTVGQVLPTVAHEMNNALQVVGGLVEMLSARADLPQDVLEKVARIGAQAARATGMMRDLVAFSRRDEAGARTVDLASVVDRALMMRRYHLARARIAVTLDVPPPGTCFTRADGHALQQVLLNVLINAEHGLAGREGGEIRIQLREDGDWIELEVTDNGPGVPTPLRERLAEPFFTTKERAAGLGLTVAPMLVASDGGRFLVDHLPGGGTRAITRLPKLRPRD